MKFKKGDYILIEQGNNRFVAVITKVTKNNFGEDLVIYDILQKENVGDYYIFNNWFTKKLFKFWDRTKVISKEEAIAELL